MTGHHNEYIGAAEPPRVKAPRTSLWKIIAFSGMFLTGLGVLFVFLHGRLSSHSTDGFLFSFFMSAELPTLTAGLFCTLVGMIGWARHLERRHRLAASGTFFIAGLLAYLSPINVHDWTFDLVFVIAGAWVIAVVLAVMAAVRRA